MDPNKKFVHLESSFNFHYHMIEDGSPEALITADDSASGGVRVEIHQEIIAGRRISLEVNIPGDSKPIKMLGEVVWQVPSPKGGLDTGIRYIKVDYDDMQRITSFTLATMKKNLKSGKSILEQVKTRKKQICDLFTREIRLPGDTSMRISVPDFLVHEIVIPGDLTRYALAKTTKEINYHLNGGTEKTVVPLCQYVSGGGPLLLLNENLPIGTKLKLTINIPNCPYTIKDIGEVFEVKNVVLYDDDTVKTYYETSVKFTNIEPKDRKQIIRFVYSCRANYIMMKRHSS